MACVTSTIEVAAVSNSAVGGTCISAPHIVQYPKIPRRNDGMWLALGNMLGSAIGKIANQDLVAKANDAEDIWKSLNDSLKAKGQEEWTRVPAQRAIADTADTFVDTLARGLDTIGNTELDYADKLKACDDMLHDKLCALSQCGYVPDYNGILLRSRGDAAALVAAKRATLFRDTTRYNTCATASMCATLSTVEIGAAISAATVARESERQAAWKYKWDTLLAATKTIEQHRVTRSELADKYITQAGTFEQSRYAAHYDEATKSLTAGADMLASAGQNYAWLAESYRRSAKDTAASWPVFTAQLALVMASFTEWGCKLAVDCDCVDASGNTTAPKTVA